MKSEREKVKGSRLYIFLYKVSYNNRNWRTHGTIMNLLINGVTDSEVGSVETDSSRVLMSSVII